MTEDNVETAGLFERLVEAIYDNGHGPSRANAEHHARAVLPIVAAERKAGAVDALREVERSIEDRYLDEPLDVVAEHIARLEAS